MPPDLAQVALPERVRAADHVLPEARLRLVQAERGRVAAERALDRAREALLVEAVARLVQDGEESREEVVLVLARRQAHVAGREARRERMRRLVEPAGLEVEADRGGQARADGALHLRGIGAVHERVVGPGPRRDRLRERHELVAQARQQRLETRHAHVGLVLVEQRVVALAALVADGVGLLAAQRDEALEGVAEEREVGARARRLPGFEARATRPARARARARRARGRRDRARAWPRARGRAASSSSPASPAELGDAPRRSARRRSARAARPRAWPWPRRAPAAPRGGMLTCSSQFSSPPTVPSWQHVALEPLEDLPGLRPLGHRHQGLSGW